MWSGHLFWEVVKSPIMIIDCIVWMTHCPTVRSPFSDQWQWYNDQEHYIMPTGAGYSFPQPIVILEWENSMQINFHNTVQFITGNLCDNELISWYHSSITRPMHYVQRLTQWYSRNESIITWWEQHETIVYALSQEERLWKTFVSYRERLWPY